MLDGLDIGMKPVLTWLQRTVLHPLAELLYPAQARGGFSHRERD